MPESPKGWAWVDGQVVPLDQARVPLDDRGHLLGDGLFETLSVRQGAIMHRDLHAARLRRGLDVLGIPVAAATTAWAAADKLVVSPTGLGPHYGLRIQVTAGRGGGVAGAGLEPRVTALARPLEPVAASTFSEGLRLGVAEERKDTHSALSGLKTLSYLPNIQARRRALAWGAQDAILFNDKGRIAEATTSNVLAFVAGALHAPGPEEGAVDGVTRRRILAWAETQRIRVVTTLTPDDAAAALEVLVSNTNLGVAPVRRIEGLKENLPGAQGPFYQRVRQALGDPLPPTV